MTHSLSTKAQVAKIARKLLKDEGIKAKVRSGKGDSIEVVIQNQPPNIKKQVHDLLSGLEMGGFDAMHDMYVSHNYNSDMPQVKYVFVHNEFDDSYKQKALDFICRDFKLPPMKLSDAPMFLEGTLLKRNTFEEIWYILADSQEAKLDGFWDAMTA